ncbi:lipoprotein signal peptidase [Flammeovirga yaeyamensis]|uniref:Lipoprotein signal peptidase n=1 Tax=Flammeovirga yaeyamensis TaxID=367791 RepID=A0AAX1N7J6_9BACT|nr:MULTISPECIES: lipoprotein signal peptidase [Flammeovirga]ANQ50363.1 lipoprotein signal peptidase [Flammeovirga sp. MY04]MBB3699681.1 signal peptidase II [Flammeovirga yaeyamensis]NMF36749.1 lipoprotein signal peptidase [Flammeovirga yaeyamensis]QWG02210.1 lipoprotein signal peptidase [Flammeovirga yaeyamensis]
MGNNKNNLYKIYGVAILVIVLDQLSKLLVHNYMEMGTLGEIKVIGDWFRLHYLLNPGMAFGMQFGNEYGKLILTTFRIIASGGIVYGIYVLNQKGAHWGFLVCGAMILGGAIGNSIDSVFYGVFIEGNMIPGSSTPWFHGQVIDMLYFPMVRGSFPDWLPFYGGERFLFFSPVFNIADSAIFLGVLFIFIFQNKFSEYEKKEKQEIATEEQ